MFRLLAVLPLLVGCAHLQMRDVPEQDPHWNYTRGALHSNVTKTLLGGAINLSAPSGGALSGTSFCITGKTADCVTDNGASTGVLWSGVLSATTGLNLRSDTATKLSIGSSSTEFVSMSATTGTILSGAASGSTALGATVNGARIDYGAGANDYASSDGTTVTFAGPIATASGAGITVNKEDGISQKIGTSASTVSVGGGLASRSTPTSNVSTGETDLQVLNVPANGLTTTAHCVILEGYGVTANNANVKTVKVYFGATVVQSATMSASIAGAFVARYTACRTGSSAQRITGSLIETNTATNAVTKMWVYQTTATETESGAIAMKLTGTSGTASNDITENQSIYWFF